jgi:hypothetical protein
VFAEALAKFKKTYRPSGSPAPDGPVPFPAKGRPPVARTAKRPRGKSKILPLGDAVRVDVAAKRLGAPKETLAAAADNLKSPDALAWLSRGTRDPETESLRMEAEIAKLTAGVDPAKTPDGPKPPNFFFWNNAAAELEPKPWAVLDFLWSQPRMPGDAGRAISTASRQKLAEHAWEDSSKKGRALTNAISKIRCEFEQNNWPLFLRCRGGGVTLEVPSLA